MYKIKTTSIINIGFLAILPNIENNYSFNFDQLDESHRKLSAVFFRYVSNYPKYVVGFSYINDGLGRIV